VSTSTVRSDLAELERLGLLMHPHTSAGRVPTEHGYRLFVDELLTRSTARPPAFPLSLAAARTEVEEALQATSEMLSQVTRLLASSLRRGSSRRRSDTSRCSPCSRMW
jgi:Transcriptional regulator of heat shock gene